MQISSRRMPHRGGAETPDATQQEASRQGSRQRLKYWEGSQTAESGDVQTGASRDGNADITWCLDFEPVCFVF